MAKSAVKDRPIESDEDTLSQPVYVTPEGKLTLEFIEAEINKPGYQGQGKSAELRFLVLDDEWATKDENGDIELDEEGNERRPVIRALVSQTLGVSKANGPSNLRRAITALLGRDLELVENPETGRKEPEKIKLSSLYGKTVTANVSADEKADGRIFPKIDFKSIKAKR